MDNFEKWVESDTYSLVQHMQTLGVARLNILVKQLQMEQQGMQMMRKTLKIPHQLSNYITTFVLERKLKDLEEIASGIIKEKSVTLTQK